MVKRLSEVAQIFYERNLKLLERRMIMHLDDDIDEINIGILYNLSMHTKSGDFPTPLLEKMMRPPRPVRSKGILDEIVSGVERVEYPWNSDLCKEKAESLKQKLMLSYNDYMRVRHAISFDKGVHRLNLDSAYQFLLASYVLEELDKTNTSLEDIGRPYGVEFERYVVAQSDLAENFNRVLKVLSGFHDLSLGTLSI